MQPNAQISLAKVIFCSKTVSGAIYIGVPAISFLSNFIVANRAASLALLKKVEIEKALICVQLLMIINETKTLTHWPLLLYQNLQFLNVPSYRPKYFLISNPCE